MRQIKFRGVDVKTGELVYGTAINIVHEYHVEIMDEKNCLWYRVHSVAQLIGVDKNGAEIYEGDKVIRQVEGTPDKEYVVHWQGFATAEDGCWIPESMFAKAVVKA